MPQTQVKQEKAHHGTNVKLARMIKDVKQHELADKLNMHQSEISNLEKQAVIADEMLEKISLALDIPMNFLKEFDVEEASKTYYNNSTISSAENSHDIVNQNQGDNVYNFPLSEVMEMTDKLLNLQKEFHDREIEILKESAAKDIKIALLEKELENLRSSK